MRAETDGSRKSVLDSKEFVLAGGDVSGVHRTSGTEGREPILDHR